MRYHEKIQIAVNAAIRGWVNGNSPARVTIGGITATCRIPIGQEPEVIWSSDPHDQWGWTVLSIPSAAIDAAWQGEQISPFVPING